MYKTNFAFFRYFFSIFLRFEEKNLNIYKNIKYTALINTLYQKEIIIHRYLLDNHQKKSFSSVSKVKFVFNKYEILIILSVNSECVDACRIIVITLRAAQIIAIATTNTNTATKETDTKIYDSDTWAISLRGLLGMKNDAVRCTRHAPNGSN